MQQRIQSTYSFQEQNCVAMEKGF